MASMSSSRRAVSRASGVPLARAEIAFPFNLLAGICKAAAPGDLACFVVASVLFPHAACDQMTGVCLPFIHRSVKGGSGSAGCPRHLTEPVSWQYDSAK